MEDYAVEMEQSDHPLLSPPPPQEAIRQAAQATEEAFLHLKRQGRLDGGYVMALM